MTFVEKTSILFCSKWLRDHLET